ncbi:uncharacterized protein THITE_2153032 [Thermothielavioides terrestris NRRL 8126]|uniref:Uncharacterized protein n=1 Tax=Thermothielavioides terrestris (strain ATCC 38088 / NRRL 8126) TaxID=578455 RepID=G2QWA1_THETT|nr:uncharacterized protein THITE_2153032 [Thermothielavioides terrestris NRRL 8126]AEO63076.1 hypothetical protein THITE_2153032 [Thermothielavioides terrestris NRRL 8126]
MKRFSVLNWLATLGVKEAIEDAAPTQQVVTATAEAVDKGAVVLVGASDNITGFVEKSKARMLDRWLDALVRVSGSEAMFIVIVLGLLTWAFLGIPFGKSADWAVMISDVQAIVSYLFDSLLMRQQLNEYERFIRVSAMLQSRNLSHRRMLRQIARGGRHVVAPEDLGNLEQVRFSEDLPKESFIGRVSTLASRIFGHIVTVGFYWLCIFIWLGFGQYCGWSDEWQLYINSATSALMVFIFAFLANIQERHTDYNDQCLNSIFEVDSAVELKLRLLSGDTMPNPAVVIPAPKVGKLQRAIFYYADLVGTLVGLAILIIAMVVWLAIGPVLSFSSDWWLIIGTYAGLVGLNDGFVLRNVQLQLSRYQDKAFDQVQLEDKAIFDDIRVSDPKIEYVEDDSLSYRLSERMGIVTSHEVTVVLGGIAILGLLAGATAMKWSTTGQLLCNIPPSVVECFFMMILITGHNISDSRRRADLRTLYVRRLKLLGYVEKLEASSP